MKSSEETWDNVINPKSGWFDLNLREIWHYRDLLMLMVRRDYVSSFKQSILGPIWFFVQPILTTIVYMVIFGTIAKLGDDGLPSMAFYLSGVILWNYFSACLTSTATTFTANAGIFGKVYFPRLISPLSVVVSNLMKFGIQFLFFISVIIYFKLTGDQKIQVTWYVLLAPLFIAMMALLGLSMGLIISSLTTKYRDLSHLVTFGVQLLMYATPVVYPLSKVSDNAKFYLLLNPMTSIIEGFRFAFLGKGTFSPSMLLYSGGVILCMLFIGVIIFSRVEKNFMDTV